MQVAAGRARVATGRTCSGQRSRRSALVVRASSKQHDEEVGMHETRLGPGVAQTKKDLTHLAWSSATVVRNDAANLEGTVRLLHLSIPEHVDMLYGRRVQGVPNAPRMIDNYSLPGQSVGVRLPGASKEGKPRLYTIASSPYASRRDSAYVDASLIEVVVAKGVSPEEDALVGLGPGAELEVSQVVGRGFSSLLNSYGGILSAIEEKRNLVLAGVGTRGISALRAVLNWQPVLAHAAGHRVTALYVARCAAQAAFVTEWDSWRDAGIQFVPLYTEPNARIAGDSPASAASAPKPAAAGGSSADALGSMSEESEEVLHLLEDAMFYGEGGFDRVAGGRAADCVVMLAGLPSSLAPKIAKELHAHKVDHERMLFCEYF